MPLPFAIPLLLAAAGVGAATHSKRRRDRADRDRSNFEEDAESFIMLGRPDKINTYRDQYNTYYGKQGDIRFQADFLEATQKGVNVKAQDAIRTIMAGQGTYDVTPQVQADEVMAGTPIGEIPSEISRVPISPEMQKRGTYRIDAEGRPTATFAPPAAPGLGYTDSPIKRSETTGEDYFIRKYDSGDYARHVIPGQAGLTPSEKTIEREAEMAVPVYKGPNGTEREGVPMIVRAGTQLPEGATSFKKFSDSNIQVSVYNDLAKKMTDTLQEKLRGANETYATISAIKSGLQPEYLKYWQQVGMGISSKIEKYTPEWMDSFIRSTPWIGEAIPSKKRVQDFARWKNLVDQYMFNWRKQITGVAGGEKEMDRIEGIAPNTDKDSYSTFLGKIELLEAIHRAVYIRARHYLTTKSLDLNTLTAEEREAELRKNPLEGDLSLYFTDPELRVAWVQTNLSPAAKAYEAKRKGGK